MDKLNTTNMHSSPEKQSSLFHGHLAWDNSHLDFIRPANGLFLRHVVEIHNSYKERSHEDKCTPDDFMPSGFDGVYDKDEETVILNRPIRRHLEVCEPPEERRKSLIDLEQERINRRGSNDAA